MSGGAPVKPDLLSIMTVAPTRRYLVALTALTICLAGCGDSGPSAPSRPTNRLVLQPGPYWLWLNGVGITLDADLPACADAIAIRGGTSVTTAVDLANQSGTWVVRSAAGSGAQMDLTFQEGSTGLVTIPISGTIKGTAIDMTALPFPNPTGVRVSIRGTSADVGEVIGHGSTNQQVVSGTVSGNIEFMDPLGHVSTCTKILLDLTPRAP